MPPIPVFTSPAGDWRHALLTALGAPSTPDNLNALNAWAASEGVDPRNNNWLAITDPGNKWPHAGVVANNGGTPVYAFPSQAIGVQATAAFLAGSYYTNVVNAFKNSAGVRAIYDAINASPWCKGCQNGHYPIVLFNGLSGGGFGNTPSSSGPPSTGSSGGTEGGEQTESNRCLIGGQTSPSIIPNVPCLLYESQAHAVLGALVLIAGAALALAGVYMAATGSKPAPRIFLSLPGGTVPMRRPGGSPMSSME